MVVHVASRRSRREPVQTKTLFSRHYLENRLPHHPEWAEDPRPAFDALRALWARAERFGEHWDEAQTEQEFVKPVLEALGWAFIVQPKARSRGRVTRPDHALFADPARAARPIPTRAGMTPSTAAPWPSPRPKSSAWNSGWQRWLTLCMHSHPKR